MSWCFRFTHSFNFWDWHPPALDKEEKLDKILSTLAQLSLGQESNKAFNSQMYCNLVDLNSRVGALETTTAEALKMSRNNSEKLANFEERLSKIEKTPPPPAPVSSRPRGTAHQFVGSEAPEIRVIGFPDLTRGTVLDAYLETLKKIYPEITFSVVPCGRLFPFHGLLRFGSTDDRSDFQKLVAQRPPPEMECDGGKCALQFKIQLPNDVADRTLEIRSASWYLHSKLESQVNGRNDIKTCFTRVVLCLFDIPIVYWIDSNMVRPRRVFDTSAYRLCLDCSALNRIVAQKNLQLDVDGFLEYLSAKFPECDLVTK